MLLRIFASPPLPARLDKLSHLRRTLSGDLAVDGRMTLKWLLKKRRVNSTDLTLYRDQRRIPVNTLINGRVPQKAGNRLTKSNDLRSKDKE
jgi:hypothetical protein